MFPRETRVPETVLQNEGGCNKSTGVNPSVSGI